MTTLTVHDIGRAGQSDATKVSTHADTSDALDTLIATYTRDAVYVRGDNRSGTIGYLNGRVFQASKTWRID